VAIMTVRVTEGKRRRPNGGREFQVHPSAQDVFLETREEGEEEVEQQGREGGKRVLIGIKSEELETRQIHPWALTATGRR